MWTFNKKQWIEEIDNKFGLPQVKEDQQMLNMMKWNVSGGHAGTDKRLNYLHLFYSVTFPLLWWSDVFTLKSVPRLHHTIVSELELFPVKKSQKFVMGEVLFSSWGVCLTQTPLSLVPLRLEQLPPPGATPSVGLGSWAWSLEEEEDGVVVWARLSRLWCEWNWRMWWMDLPGGTSAPPAGREERWIDG